MLDKVETGEYDLILLDLEMPQVDGWQALQMIRQKEADSGLRRIPIIAVTADASTEIGDAALQAGMNGYLSKPFKMERLQEALQPFLALAYSDSGPPIFDRSAALEAVGGSDTILAEVVEIFMQEDYPRHLQELKAAIETQDGERLRKTAHGLKGTLATFGASAAADVARQLQEIGMHGKINLASGKSAELEREVEHFATNFAPLPGHSTPSGDVLIPDTD